MAEAAATRASARARFLAEAGWGGAEAEWRPGDASFRRYARLTLGGRTAMLMDAPPDREPVGPFLRARRLLADAGLSVPLVLASDASRGFLLLEDFGDATFTALLDAGADPGPLYDLAVDALLRLREAHPAGARALPRYDAAARTDHLSTFLDWLWPEVGAEGMAARPTPAERAVFRALWLEALKQAPTLGRGLVHRDFHVDNLMRLPGRNGVAACGVLDFQDAGCGPFAYDLASLTEDARRDLDPALKRRCLDRYRTGVPGLGQDELSAALAVHGGQRHMRVAGLWVRLWRRDGKPGYLRHMRRTLSLLESNLAHPVLGDVRAFLEEAFPATARARARALAETAP